MRRAHRAVSQNARQFLILIVFGNGGTMSQRALGFLQKFQSGVIVGLILGQVTECLRLLQVLFFGVSGLGYLLEQLVGFGEFAFAHKGHCILHAVGEPVGLIVSEADGLFVLHAGLLLV